MLADLTIEQLLGRDETHLFGLADGHQLHPAVASAFVALKADALLAGFDLSIASSFRSFERQCLIWNDKVTGLRPIYDDLGRQLETQELGAQELLHAILRYSALPGTSRHHWGTDLDVFDAAAIPEGYQLQLSPEEVAAGGLFDALHCWLDERMAAEQSHGFYRPYNVDRGGVALERWHLSYAPLACRCESICYQSSLETALAEQEIGLYEQIQADLKSLLSRYVAVPESWCPPACRG